MPSDQQRFDSSPPRVDHSAEGLLDLFVDAVREYAIFMLDPAGVVVTWNAGAERIKGYAAHEIIGQHFRTFYLPGDVAVPARAGVGHGVTEAPRGVLYHRYQLDTEGTVLDARIVPPTSQNQRSIEADLLTFVQARLHLDDEQLTHDCEQAIRNYDPCISCATHFLDLTVERS